MYKISKCFKFDAAHQLLGLPEGHKCGNLHGHTYTVRLTLAAQFLNSEYDWVKDFGELKSFQLYIDKQLDHQNLNDVLDMQTTAENIARHLYDVASSLYLGSGVDVWSVRVSETGSSWAEYTR